MKQTMRKGVSIATAMFMGALTLFGCSKQSKEKIIKSFKEFPIVKKIVGETSQNLVVYVDDVNKKNLDKTGGDDNDFEKTLEENGLLEGATKTTLITDKETNETIAMTVKYENGEEVTFMKKSFETLDGDPPFSYEDGKLIYNIEGGFATPDVEKLNSFLDDMEDEETKQAIISFFTTPENFEGLKQREIIAQVLEITNLLLTEGDRAARGKDKEAKTRSTPAYSKVYEVVSKYNQQREQARLDAEARDGNLNTDLDPASKNVDTDSNSDPFADPKFDVASDDLERSEQALAEARERLQTSIENLENTNEDWNETRNKLIQVASDYVEAGGNPADLPGWEETSEKFNISPDDL